MLFERQKHLLALLDALGGNMGHLDFQKLLFLWCIEWEDSPSYEFIPYKFGGFSFTSYADKRKLIASELLVEDDRNWTLTAHGRAAADPPVNTRSRMARFTRSYAGVRGDMLILETYRKHPWYATRSEIADRVLADDETALNAVRRARPKPGLPGVCTIGYEGRTLENYLDRLLHDGVTLVCDVRRNPLSRKYGFSKTTLAKGCEGVGLRYEHLPELGIASEDRQSLQTQADYDVLFEAYRKQILPERQSSLERIHGLVDGGQRVALTCYEQQPEQCHRHCVAEALERRYGPIFAPRHL